MFGASDALQKELASKNGLLQVAFAISGAEWGDEIGHLYCFVPGTTEKLYTRRLWYSEDTELYGLETISYAKPERDIFGNIQRLLEHYSFNISRGSKKETHFDLASLKKSIMKAAGTYVEPVPEKPFDYGSILDFGTL